MEPPDDAVETIGSTFWMEDGIVRAVLNDQPRTPETVAEGVAAVRGLIGGTPRPALFEVGKRFSAEAVAWLAFAADAESLFTANAFVIDPEFPVEVGPFPGAIDRLLLPTQVFTDEAEALAFLRRYLPDE